MLSGAAHVRVWLLGWDEAPPELKQRMVDYCVGFERAGIDIRVILRTLGGVDLEDWPALQAKVLVPLADPVTTNVVLGYHEQHLRFWTKGMMNLFINVGDETIELTPEWQHLWTRDHVPPDKIDSRWPLP